MNLKEICGAEVFVDGVPEYTKSWLLEWAWMVQRYCDAVMQDTSYHHGERANVGLLNAAAWRTGLIALEEFPTEKADQNNGRSDLWIRDESSRKNAWFEVKHQPSEITGALEKALESLQSATDDAKEVKGEHGDQKFGLVFLVLEHDHGQKVDPADLRKLLDELREGLNRGEIGAIGWSFLANPPTELVRAYHGVITLIRRVLP